MKKLLLSAVAAGTLLAAVAQNPQFDAMRKLQLTEAIIENYYVDSVNPDTVVQEAIIAMLKTLDPHSTYTTAEETKALTEPLNGNFSGIGVQFQMSQDTVYVIQPTAGGPSEKVGIIPGDRIVAANDTAIAGVKMPQSAVMKRLRGPKGSIVKLKVVRRSEADTLEFRVKRDDIPLYTVDASYMADPTTGYIRISSFGAETASEFVKAYNQLVGKGMKNLIIDLQDNGGGYLNAAVDVSQMFLNPGSTIVFTQGLHQSPQFFFAEQTRPIVDNRVIVLTNEYSASAAEILSGALQDNDRGLIVGRRTFGKGLVQRPFPFPDGSMVRLTTAHYYTPSGRSIQKPYTKGETDTYGEDLIERYKHGEFSSADSIKLDKSKKFSTINNNRAVYGGGGIMPDLFVPIDTTGVNKYYRELRAKNVINQFVLDYVEQHRSTLKKEYKNEDAFIDRFAVTDRMIDEFVALGQKLGVEADAGQLAECRPFLDLVIKGLVGRDLFTASTYSRVVNPINPVYREALKLINDTERYEALLKGDRK
ncbi:MAG: S41 family peptidase [Muribaculaceae bacterium]|nr:S41 family peptidase [Muribaculaceae bacterium]